MMKTKLLFRSTLLGTLTHKFKIQSTGLKQLCMVTNMHAMCMQRLLSAQNYMHIN